MNKTWNKTYIMLLLMISVIGMVSIGMLSTAQGHILWINASNSSPRVGENITIEIGFGHKYPHTETVKEKNIERIFIRDPMAQELTMERVSPAKYTFSPASEGQYEVIVILKPGFVSNTTDGRKLGNKKTLDGVVSCFSFSMNAKTLINAGSKGNRPSYKSNLPLEIILPENINNLKVGDELLLKVMYQGKALSGAKVSAIDEKTALKEEGKWLQESESDTKGMVRIKLTSKGPWLITATHELPYTDLSECDKFFYRTTLTISLE